MLLATTTAQLQRPLIQELGLPFVNSQVLICLLQAHYMYQIVHIHINHNLLVRVHVLNAKKNCCTGSSFLPASVCFDHTKEGLFGSTDVVLH